MYSARGRSRPKPWSGRHSDSPTAAGRPAAVARADRRVGLGHARLSIIDLTTGDQPIASEDERMQIVVNGEFYDFERTQRELEGGATASAPAPTARSPCTSTRTSARPASTTCAASSPSCSGTSPTTRCSPPGIASASSRSTTRPTAARCTWRRRRRRCFAAGVPARWDHAAFFQANHFIGTPTPRTAHSSTASTRCRPATTCSPTASTSG